MLAIEKGAPARAGLVGAGIVDDDDLPVAAPLFEEARWQP